MATSLSKPAAVPDKETSQEELGDVVNSREVHRFRDLGLGRGVNATDPNMWKNKTPFIMKHICPDLSNIIGTEEGGIKQYFADEVSSLTSHQQNIKLSLDEPSSQVKVGIDAEHSRSTSSTHKTVGAKALTRTISFRTDFSDLPIYSLNDRDKLTTRKLESLKVGDGSLRIPESFESQLCSWIIDRIQGEKHLQKHSATETGGDGSEDSLVVFRGETQVERLSNYLVPLKTGSLELKAIACYCKEFVKELGVTHYVSAIELGAMKYQVLTTGEYEKKFGAGAKLGVDHIAQATVSAKSRKFQLHKSTKLREVGKIPENGDVKRNSSGEAVIGFHIQPIHKLVQLLYIQVALQKAVKEFIDEKSNKSEGPFLISSKVDNKPIYWTVNQNYQVLGTPSVGNASLFYVLPTEDGSHPFEFFLAYYGENKDARKLPMSLHDPMVKYSEQAPLPRFLKCDPSIFGYSDGPLELKSSANEEHTRFSLFNKITHTYLWCCSMPVSSSAWIEGDEFFINCSRRNFRIDGYLAMKKVPKTSKDDLHDTEDLEMKPTATEQPNYHYMTVTLPTSQANDDKSVGMLFRLHPAERREKQIKRKSVTEQTPLLGEDRPHFLTTSHPTSITERREKRISKTDIDPDTPTGGYDYFFTRIYGQSP